jgi:hypothetical protein
MLASSSAPPPDGSNAIRPQPTSAIHIAHLIRDLEYVTSVDVRMR